MARAGHRPAYLACALISSLLGLAEPASQPTKREPQSSLPLCRNGSHLLKGGKWHQPNQIWAPDPAISGCRSAGITGVEALEGLRSTHLVFIGDSMLRQVFHAFVHGTLREMPTIVDPVYGLAHYSAAPPSKEYPFWRDTLKASNKDMGSNLRNFESMGKSTLPGWSVEEGVEATYGFINACVNVVDWIQTLLESPSLAARVSSPGGRRVIFVTNVGASNVKANPDIARCLSQDLPLAYHALASHWPPVNPRIIVESSSSSSSTPDAAASSGQQQRQRELFGSMSSPLGLSSSHHQHHHHHASSSSTTSSSKSSVEPAGSTRGASLSAAELSMLHPSATAHRFVVMNQPIKNSRLRDRVSDFNMQRGIDAVDYALNSINHGTLGHKGRSSNSGSSSSSGNTTVSPPQHLYGHLIDFLNLLAPSYDDPMAPPDATRPSAEDNLHLGCQWRVPSLGVKLELYNTAGRHAMGVAGMHLVNHIRGEHEVQGKRAVGRAKRWMIEADAHSKEKEQHCTLVCKAKTLLALSDMLLTFVVPEHYYRAISAASNAKARPVYEVVQCQPSYAKIPCPLFPHPGANEAMSVEIAKQWETPSVDKITREAQENRVLAVSAFSTSEAKLAQELGTSVLDSFDSWVNDYNAGRFLECKDFSGHSERVHYESSEWCLAALSGPGGRFLRDSSSSSSSSSGSITSSSSGASSTAGPLGVWCALPLSGRYIVPPTGKAESSPLPSSLADLRRSSNGTLNATAIAKITGLPHLAPSGELPGSFTPQLNTHGMSLAERRQYMRHSARHDEGGKEEHATDGSSHESPHSLSHTRSRRSKQINVTEFEMMAKLSPSERRVVWKKRLAEKAAEDAARAAARAAATESS